jgi:hypothetical protein
MAGALGRGGVQDLGQGMEAKRGCLRPRGGWSVKYALAGLIFTLTSVWCCTDE